MSTETPEFVGEHDIDATTLDIVESTLENTRHEMDRVLETTAISPVIREQSAVIATSGLAPDRMTADQVAVVALKGRELGVPPMQALSHIHVIKGKPTLSAEMMRALITRAGHRIRIVVQQQDCAFLPKMTRCDLDRDGIQDARQHGRFGVGRIRPRMGHGGDQRQRRRPRRRLTPPSTRHFRAVPRRTGADRTRPRSGVPARRICSGRSGGTHSRYCRRCARSAPR